MMKADQHGGDGRRPGRERGRGDVEGAVTVGTEIGGPGWMEGEPSAVWVRLVKCLQK